MWKIEKIVSKGDYNYAIVRGHPCATKNSYVLEHRVVVENHLGRILGSDEVVHHINGDRKDNRLENLEVLSSTEHRRNHCISRGRKTVDLVCPWCKKVFVRRHGNTHLSKGTSWTSCSSTCRGKFSRRVQLQGRTPEVDAAISGNVLKVYRTYKKIPRKP